MRFLTQKEFKKMILKSWERIEENKEEINKINVFPVPDMDTGSNLAKTLEGPKNALENKEFKDTRELSEVVLDSALNSAQGNTGVIFTGFLSGFLPFLNENPIDAKKLAKAFEKGAEKARDSIQNPKEGTILDVIDAAAKSLKENSEKETDISSLFREAIKRAGEALLATREKIEVLRKANVVDAGGLGFLMVLESYLEALTPSFAKSSGKEEKPSEKVRRFIQTISYRYEVVFLISNPEAKVGDLREKLKKLGNSLEVLKIKDKIKVHIHTDDPDEVKEIARRSGQILDLKVEDLAKEIMGEKPQKKVSIGIVTEDLSTLLPKILQRYRIEVVKVKLDWPEAEKIQGENLYQKVRKAWKLGIKTLLKTSQPAPKDYLLAFKKQLERFDKVLCITLTSKISGCYNSAIQARKMVREPERIFIFDSQTAAAAEALLVLRAIELIQERKEIEEIIDELKNLVSKTHLYVIFDDPKGVENIGRITTSQANWIRRMKKIHIHPIIELKEGKLEKGGIVFAKDLAEALFKKVKKESKRARAEGKRVRAIINHADNLEQAEKLKKMLKEKIEAEVSFISEGPPIVCAVAGPGSLVVGWHQI